MGVELFNHLPNLSTKAVDFLGSFLSLLTKLGRNGERYEVQRSLRIVPIDHLNGERWVALLGALLKANLACGRSSSQAFTFFFTSTLSKVFG